MDQGAAGGSGQTALIRQPNSTAARNDAASDRLDDLVPGNLDYETPDFHHPLN